MSPQLLKLAMAIRNANEFIVATQQSDAQPGRKGRKAYTSSADTSPTAEEQSAHESSVPFKDKIDFSQEPSIEYLD
jgi:hypothetical protein